VRERLVAVAHPSRRSQKKPLTFLIRCILESVLGGGGDATNNLDLIVRMRHFSFVLRCRVSKVRPSVIGAVAALRHRNDYLAVKRSSPANRGVPSNSW
jgi:hypothetical protein